MFRILLTGASGFIGTNLLKRFLDKQYQVINIDIVAPKDKSLYQYWKNVNIENCSDFVDTIISFSPDYIVHLAARTDLNGRLLDDYAANTIGTYNLMQAVSALPKLKKVIITSSMLVCRTAYYPQNQFDYLPSTIYGESKVETEKIVWANKPQCDWAIIRPTSIWGPWFGIPYRNFFDMIINHRYFHIGNRGCTKTYGYVGNAVYQIEQILFNDTANENEKIFYIGDMPSTNIEIWADEIARELGFKIKRIPFWVIRVAAYTGDFLKKIGITFPMTTFRLKNMTTDNVIDLSGTYNIAPNPPYTRIQGIKETLKWLEK